MEDTTMTETTTPTISWQEWLNESNDAPVFFILNSLARPNPVEHFYLNDWVEEAFPLYSGTPMRKMLKQSPWLVQAKTRQLYQIGMMLDSHTLSDNSWGWAYRSRASWQEQLAHWQRRHLVMMNGEQVLFRIMDSRVFGAMVPAFTPSDWSLMLAPVTELMLDTPQPVKFCRPEVCGEGNSEIPFTLGEHLLAVWLHSPYGLKVLSSSLYYDLWENHGEMVQQLDQPMGSLKSQIELWLRKKIETGQYVEKLSSQDYLLAMEQEKE
ncbi:DUF4123 domain-containing protein [Xenorhabdus szentirmaii]|uniref:DUF4123 domain-containing protein n=2 Tax=Xenorhabdus szentirmaii TaxID=290112 RepID=W1J4P0_9GAMM|nr:MULTISPECIES: DUF4123 domain-containing protein [Xenorhabdus]MBD2794361.1 DUF4123 domain-containing protein [Xenorhabdus sp. CUL]MBD2799912.1 DUF4123 domain-containing protein [Xenorhabdus sp. M]MBD2821932.1 DUF4123 domain-containing protein [Xenorhabdus sp. 42]MBD2825623.1 DUF4123 domain-containing protein [Xenorhabdus sp. 5]PHM30922.1 hypothetical protein Xsze_04040 [Xenorhabdus szentirmaii DSM 16338]